MTLTRASILTRGAKKNLKERAAVTFSHFRVYLVAATGMPSVLYTAKVSAAFHCDFSCCAGYQRCTK